VLPHPAKFWNLLAPAHIPQVSFAQTTPQNFHIYKLADADLAALVGSPSPDFGPRFLPGHSPPPQTQLFPRPGWLRPHPFFFFFLRAWESFPRNFSKLSPFFFNCRFPKQSEPPPLLGSPLRSQPCREEGAATLPPPPHVLTGEKSLEESPRFRSPPRFSPKVVAFLIVFVPLFYFSPTLMDPRSTRTPPCKTTPAPQTPSSFLPPPPGYKLAPLRF